MQPRDGGCQHGRAATTRAKPANPATRAPGALAAFCLLNRSIVRLGPLAHVRHRDLDGMLVTMRSAGSHYLKWLLCMAMHEGLGVPHPVHMNDTSQIGYIHKRPTTPGVPRVVRTHTEMPVRLYRMLRGRMRFPRYVVLVRDLRHAMVSYYEKDPPEDRRATFGEYLRGRDSFRFDHALYRQIRFLNSWARVRRLDPHRVLVVRYEDLIADPAAEARRVWFHLGFPAVGGDVFDRAAMLSTKERMAQFEDGVERRVVRRDRRHPFEWFGEADRAYLGAALERGLVDSYGYDYSDWTVSGASQSAGASGVFEAGAGVGAP